MQSPVQSELPQLEAMRAGVDYSWRIKCRKQEFTVRPLTAMEIIKIAEEVQDELELLPENRRLGVRASLMSAAKTLEVASTPPGGVPTLTVAMTSQMTPAEVSHLHDQYVAGCARVNPSLEMLTVEQVKAMVDEVKKNPEIDSTAITRFLSDLANSYLLLLGESVN